MVNVTEAHPSPGIEAALDACRRAGLATIRAGQGPLWGWVECVTGARRISVPVWAEDPARQRTRLMIFLDNHVAHRPRPKRPGRRGR
ncbi:hypothetical protein J2S43_000035 [Catenuloplanes nepalensis]|uniref:Uncharacterized protein n=1 Tax=Catenuloplanes nepalensis TaxID=587533 RepID=A0ABT9MJP6_9ACTN|nr:hypothetical protein [Catenuloplanes nepalensis]MDP9791523.1 hypothetical protein [Catenuloplanes nepalensis]